MSDPRISNNPLEPMKYQNDPVKCHLATYSGKQGSKIKTMNFTKVMNQLNGFQEKLLTNQI